MKKGFTLLEVVLVVAISTLLFMSVTIGIGSRISSGRYETASTEITDYLRDVYTVALNTENSREGLEGARKYCTLYSATNTSEEATVSNAIPLYTNEKKANGTDTKIDTQDLYPGRTNCAIYGKAMYFGAKDGKVHVFDVVGNAVNNYKKTDVNGKETTMLKGLEEKTVLEQLKDVRADIFAALPENIKAANLENDLSNYCRPSFAGKESTYEPNWGALFETANFGGSTSRDSGGNFIGMVMIVRAPASGNVSTFFYEQPSNGGGWEFLDDPDSLYSDGDSCGDYNKESSAYKDIVDKYSPVQLMNAQNDGGTSPENTGFCIGSDDFYVAISGRKKYVEFIPGGQNASAVKLVESNDKEENPCLR